jgi:hypothetical protein
MKYFDSYRKRFCQLNCDMSNDMQNYFVTVLKESSGVINSCVNQQYS